MWMLKDVDEYMNVDVDEYMNVYVYGDIDV